MEFIIQKELFLNTLRIAEHISSTKGIQIILSNVYIEATDKNEVILKSSDLDIGVILKIKADVKKAGKITFSFYRFFKKGLCGALTGQESGTESDLQVVPARIGIQIHHFSGQVQSGNIFDFQCFG